MLAALIRSYRDAFSGLPRQVWVLASCLFVNRIGMMVLPFLGLYLTEERGYAIDTAGKLVGMYGVGSILGVSLGGHLADRFGPRRVQLTSLVVNGILLVALGYVRSTLLIGATIAASSLAADTFRPANGAAISAVVGPEKRARSFSLMSFAVSLGLTVGLPLGGWLAELDYLWLFWIDGGTALLAAAVLYTLGERTPPPAHEELARARATASPWSDGPFVAFALLVCLTAIVLFQFFGALPLFLKRDLAFSEWDVGLALALNSILILLFEMQLVRRVESRSPLPIVAIGSATICLGYALNSFASGWIGVLFSIGVWSLGEMFFFPLTAAFASHRAPPGATGRYMALFQLGLALPLALAPYVGTELYDKGGPALLWPACGAVGLLVLAGHFALARATRTNMRGPEA